MPAEPLTRRFGMPGRQDLGLLQPVVEVGGEADGVLVDVRQQLHRDRRQARLGVPIGRRRVAVDGAEVPLAVDQRVAQGEVLHHAHERVVDRRVAVRVVLAEHVADHRRRLLVRPARHQPELVHRVQHAPVHGLQPVAHVRQRPRHDDAHRVVEEGFLDLLVDEPRDDALAIVGSGHGPTLRREKCTRLPRTTHGHATRIQAENQPRNITRRTPAGQPFRLSVSRYLSIIYDLSSATGQWPKSAGGRGGGIAPSMATM
jgi:hypothetical protein